MAETAEVPSLTGLEARSPKWALRSWNDGVGRLHFLQRLYGERVLGLSRVVAAPGCWLRLRRSNRGQYPLLPLLSPILPSPLWVPNLSLTEDTCDAIWGPTENPK